MSVEGYNQSNTASIDGLNTLYYDYLTDGKIIMENGDLLGGNIISTKQLFINGAQITATENTITITGPAGPAGLQGVKGDRGDSGGIGIKGDRGEQGPRGEKGESDIASSLIGDGLIAVAIAGVVTYFNGLIATIDATIAGIIARVVLLETKTTHISATELVQETTIKGLVTINDITGGHGVKLYSTGRVEADTLIPINTTTNTLTLGNGGETVVKGNLTIMDGDLNKVVLSKTGSIIVDDIRSSSGHSLNIGKGGLNFVNIGDTTLTTTTNFLGAVFLNGRPLSNPFYDNFFDQFR